MALRFDRLIEPVNPFLMRISFLSKLAVWCRQHPAVYNDNEYPSYRYDKRYDLFGFLIHSEQLEGAIDFLEFGTAQGHSFRWWQQHNKHSSSRFFGFDTFTGLPENWGLYKPGTFSTDKKLPGVDDDRCSFEVGLFQETLPRFLQSFSSTQRKVIHLDADLYSSTLFVLTSIAPKLNSGDILVFDEFGVPTHEFRAFIDFVSSYHLKYEVLAAVNNYLQVAIKLH